MAKFNVGDKVRAKIDLIDDLRDEGLGCYICAKAGETLVVRGMSEYFPERYKVSHEHITDRSFFADLAELEAAQREGGTA